MIRLLLSLIIIILLITYVIIPLVKPLRKFFKKEAQRIDKTLVDKNEEENDKNEL